jgi:hypothetical protein
LFFTLIELGVSVYSIYTPVAQLVEEADMELTEELSFFFGDNHL